ncbi:C40 family peptidase [Actinokineospora sp. HBU206404]|uniref:C40 family peptidase n=2 Tax=Actinokineospora xionganensis TaxID=2684470 RepID=A0ABR7KZS5_9PSEU|nr:C40 family peptidase [Actinokineospora xionganensis]
MAIAATLLLTAVTAPPAAAQPEDAKKRYEQLSEQAGQLDEDLLKAQEDLKGKRAELDKANADLEQARSVESQAVAAQEQFRDEVDDLATASFQGARFSRVSALLTGDSPDDFLARAAALQMIAGRSTRSLDGLSLAVRQADQARLGAEDAGRRARGATDAAAGLVEQIKQKQIELDKQILEVKQALNALPAADRAELRRVTDTGVYLGPPGAADTALQAALGRRGSEYEWAAVGPNEFDCSGLTMWAYAKAGISLPHSSRAQFTLGRPVSRDQLQPGDLVFYDDGTANPSRIHHVGMYVGADKMVDAPTEGQLVDVRSVRGDGHYIGARRIVG